MDHYNTCLIFEVIVYNNDFFIIIIIIFTLPAQANLWAA